MARCPEKNPNKGKKRKNWDGQRSQTESDALRQSERENGQVSDNAAEDQPPILNRFHNPFHNPFPYTFPTPRGVTNPIIMPIRLSKLCAYFVWSFFASLFLDFNPFFFYFLVGSSFCICRALWPLRIFHGGGRGLALPLSASAWFSLLWFLAEHHLNMHERRVLWWMTRA